MSSKTELKVYNHRQAQQLLEEFNQIGAELFFAVGITIDTKQINIYRNNKRTNEDLIQCLEWVLNQLKQSQKKAN